MRALVLFYKSLSKYCTLQTCRRHPAYGLVSINRGANTTRHPYGCLRNITDELPFHSLVGPILSLSFSSSCDRLPGVVYKWEKLLVGACS